MSDNTYTVTRKYDVSDFDIIMYELSAWERDSVIDRREPYITILRGNNNIIKVSWVANIRSEQPIHTWYSEIRQVIGDSDYKHVSLSNDEMRTLSEYYVTSQRNDISYINKEIGVGVRIPIMPELTHNTLHDGGFGSSTYEPTYITL